MSAQTSKRYKEVLAEFVSLGDDIAEDREDALTRELDGLWYGFTEDERADAEAFGRQLSRGEIDARRYLAERAFANALGTSTTIVQSQARIIAKLVRDFSVFAEPLTATVAPGRGLSKVPIVAVTLETTQIGGNLVRRESRSGGNAPVSWKAHGGVRLSV